MLRDGWRLAVGTLTALPVRPPSVVDRRRAGLAMLMAPLAVLPLALAIAAIAVAGDQVGLPTLAIALLALGAIALGNRGLHLDGLSDVADGLTASYDRERSLAVMKTGTSGPAGGVAIFFVLGLQTVGLASLLGSSDLWSGAALAGLAVCASRLALLGCCLRGIPAARVDGLGTTYTQTVSPALAGVLLVIAAAILSVTAHWAGLDWWRGAVAIGVAAVVVAVVLRRVVRRFGGVTGDVFGATIELSLAALLVALS